MTGALLPSEWEPLLFFLLIIALWPALSALISLFSGWSSLAKQFRATASSSGDRFWFVSGWLNVGILPVTYKNCLFLTVGDQGIRMAVFFPFRVLHPPLFIPWAMVESVEKKQILFFRHARIRIRGHAPIISIHGRASRRILELHARNIPVAMPTRLAS